MKINVSKFSIYAYVATADGNTVTCVLCQKPDGKWDWALLKDYVAYPLGLNAFSPGEAVQELFGISRAFVRN